MSRSLYVKEPPRTPCPRCGCNCTSTVPAPVGSPFKGVCELCRLALTGVFFTTDFNVQAVKCPYGHPTGLDPKGTHVWWVTCPTCAAGGAPPPEVNQDILSRTQKEKLKAQETYQVNLFEQPAPSGAAVDDTAEDAA